MRSRLSPICPPPACADQEVADGIASGIATGVMSGMVSGLTSGIASSLPSGIETPDTMLNLRKVRGGCQGSDRHLCI